MDLARLLSEIKPLCDDPAANLDAITTALEREHDLAEYEVVRFMVYKAVGSAVSTLLRSPDPRERLRAVKAIGYIYPRVEAARLLRHAVKDPDPRTRARARYSVRMLGIDDVALPDTRPFPEWMGLGGWSPTGWSFGTFGGYLRRPTRSDLLERHGLPALSSVDDVAALVGVGSAADLKIFLRPGVGPGAPYVEFDIAKASGGRRRISAPRQALKKIQRIILREILARLPVHEACHGFVSGRSIVTHAEPHSGAQVLVKTDIRNFFPTIHYRRVQGLFEHYGYPWDVAGILAGLTTHRPVLDDGTVAWPGVLPQGAPTSPAIANLVCRRLDARLSALAASVGARYTRYADDLTFSFHDGVPDSADANDERSGQALGRFLWWIDGICQQEGFVEHPGKRRILRRAGQQRVTGVVVNSGLTVPRSERRRFRAILENCRRHGLASQAGDRSPDEFRDYLRGFAAYVKMVQPDLGTRLVAQVDEILAT